MQIFADSFIFSKVECWVWKQKAGENTTTWFKTPKTSAKERHGTAQEEFKRIVWKEKLEIRDGEKRNEFGYK